MIKILAQSPSINPSPFLHAACLIRSRDDRVISEHPVLHPLSQWWVFSVRVRIVFTSIDEIDRHGMLFYIAHHWISFICLFSRMMTRGTMKLSFSKVLFQIAFDDLVYLIGGRKGKGEGNILSIFVMYFTVFWSFTHLYYNTPQCFGALPVLYLIWYFFKKHSSHY